MDLRSKDPNNRALRAQIPLIRKYLGLGFQTTRGSVVSQPKTTQPREGGQAA